jgi:hypothetical protein
MRVQTARLWTLSAVLGAAVVTACVSSPQARPEFRPISGCALWAMPPPFSPEPSARLTFVGGFPFAASTRLHFVSFSVSAQEELRLERCGEQCSTAKLVRSWNKANFDKSPSQELVLDEAGDYYLWLRKQLPNGEIGPVPAEAATFERESGVLRFASGTVVFVAIDGFGCR